ncbi:MAG TPA: DUF559 domain-containing protein [Acidimicrobiales bacterium]|nr:DUF559 domain-containing protein [Acidimicrobiales bacterium]
MGPITWLDGLGAGQHGLVTREQLHAAGVSEPTVGRWLGAGRVVAVFPSVYRVAGAPVTWEQRVLAAVLGAGQGAVASHRSAARLWGLLDDDTVEVSVPRPRRPRLHGVVLHRSGDLGAARAVRRRGVPTTTPMRALVDLGAVLPAGAVEDALERALEARLLTVAGVEQALEEVAGPGRSGAGVLRGVLDRRALGADRPDSLLEPRMARLMRVHRLPPAAFQHEVREAGRFVARVDFAYPDRRLALEVDGHAAHASPQAFQHDLERQNALVALGWTVLRFTWADVVRRPDRVAAQVRRVLGTVPIA